MRTFTYHVDSAQAGKTVARFLKGVHGYSSRMLTGLRKDEKGILRNGTHIRTVDELCAGDTLQVRFLDEENTYYPLKQAVPVLYEDEDYIAYDKPPAMPTHTSWGHPRDTLANVYAAHCHATGVHSLFRPMGRLDRDTTGCLIVAKHALAAYRFQVEEKTYLGLAGGTFDEKNGTVDAPIAKQWCEGSTRRVDPDGQRAVTHYRVLKQFPTHALLRFSLETGRTHQIRVHMAHIGHPLVGDPQYGGDLQRLQRQALHCEKVVFCHPFTGKTVNITAPAPCDFL